VIRLAAPQQFNGPTINEANVKSGRVVPLPLL
jgi:hypothetical protein